MRTDLLTHRPEAPALGKTQHSEFRSILQKVAYTREGRPDIDFVVSHLQRLQSAPTATDWNDLMHLLQYLSTRSQITGSLMAPAIYSYEHTSMPPIT